MAKRKNPAAVALGRKGGKARTAAKADAAFWTEFDSLSRDYSGRPTPLYLAEKLTGHSGGARIFLKREDMAHTGAHKINNALEIGRASCRERV